MNQVNLRQQYEIKTIGFEFFGIGSFRGRVVRTASEACTQRTRTYHAEFQEIEKKNTLNGLSIFMAKFPAKND